METWTHCGEFGWICEENEDIEWDTVVSWCMSVCELVIGC